MENSTTHGKGSAVSRFQAYGKLHRLFTEHSSLAYGNYLFFSNKKRQKISVICPASPAASSVTRLPRRTPAAPPTANK
jgi:hypothetical protein